MPLQNDPRVPPTMMKKEGRFQNKPASPVAITPPTINTKLITTPSNVDFPNFDNVESSYFNDFLCYSYPLEN
jgi:hypothetical protein